MRNNGFTLLELLVAITVSTILLTIGIPNFLHMVAENQRTAYTADFFSSLMLARSEAIARNVDVIVCKSQPPADGVEDNRSCNSDGSWAGGWVIYANIDNSFSDPEPDSSDQRLQTHRALEHFNFSSDDLPQRVVYLPSGRAQSTGVFHLCPTSGDLAGRMIQITSTGRPRTASYDCSGS